MTFSCFVSSSKIRSAGGQDEHPCDVNSSMTIGVSIFGMVVLCCAFTLCDAMSVKHVIMVQNRNFIEWDLIYLRQ